MEESILTSIKKLLGIMEDDTCFDLDVIMGINTTLAILTQLGVGPEEGFSITDKTAVWSDFLSSEVQLNPVKSYVHLKTKLIFDPPQSSAVIDCINRMLSELEWRNCEIAEELRNSEVS